MMQAEHLAEQTDARIFEKLARRLSELAQDTAQVGQSVAELTANMTASLEPATIRDLQKLDNLHQSLCDLAHLSAALAGPDALRAQALEHLKLTATRSLLDTTICDRPAAHGSIDLF